MNSSDVRQAVTDYVKANGLINETNKRQAMESNLSSTCERQCI